MEDDFVSKLIKFSTSSLQSNVVIFIIQCLKLNFWQHFYIHYIHFQLKLIQKLCLTLTSKTDCEICYFYSEDNCN